MPLHGDFGGGSRRVIERVLRGLLLATIVIAIVIAIQTLRERRVAYVRGGPAAVSSAVARWSSVEAPSEAHVVFDSVATSDVRDWMAALRRTSTRLTWDGPALTPVAVGVQPVIDPHRPIRMAIAAPRGSKIAISDTLGPIDSVEIHNDGAVITLAGVEGAVRASVGGTVANNIPHDSVGLKSILVLGVASWDGKYIMATLEEQGWTMDARFILAPTGDVVQNAKAITIDTSRYAAVIAVDSSAAKYSAQIARFVRSGGGFIASGEAAGVSAFSELLPADGGALIPPPPIEGDSSDPRGSLPLIPLTHLKSDAIVLENARGFTTVAARRVGKGRVLQVGYLNTWRWRLGGTGDMQAPVRAYRTWWAALVSSVAYAPRWEMAQRPTDPAPVSALVETLGPPVSRAETKASFLNDPRLLAILFAIAVGALFMETASRRLRGRT